MSDNLPLVCLITAGHLASTPRLVKEADALVEAGFRVRVIAGRHYPPVDPLDRDVLAHARWGCTTVDYRSGAGVTVRKILRQFAQRVCARTATPNLRLAARAIHPQTLRFAAVAARLPAQLFIGHCVAGIAAAGFAAARTGQSGGCDLEDFHDAETDMVMRDSAERNATRALQTHFLPRARHVTAAAPLIARAYAENYGVTPTVVLNVFPRHEAPPAPVDAGPVSAANPARLYWFSQTIGPGRGLEHIVSVLGRMRVPAELHLRGALAPGFDTALRRVAQPASATRPIHFHPSAAPREMARLAASAHLGLSLEESTPLNRDLCLTNKVFIYLLAGIPQLLSATSAQSAIVPELGDAGMLAHLDRPDLTARTLDDFFSNPALVYAARRTAWTLGQTKYCWDAEQDKFLDSIRQHVG